MAKDPRHRFASAKEFGDYLRRAHYDEALTVFDPSKFAPRLEKAADGYQLGNLEFAQELINELESEGYRSTELEALSSNVKAAVKQKTIEHLLDSARARVQDGEYRLALQRVHEVLQLEARQEDALVLQHDIEARRAEADISEWLRVGHQHLEKFSFSHARQAAQRILEIRPGEERAVQFLSQVERRESEVLLIREHKREAYAAALDAEKRNDLSSALSRMKEVMELERKAPDSKEPGSLAAYQSLYNRLHSEHEAIAASYGEAKQALERGDYVASSGLCDKFLAKFPQHTLFKALKFDTEQRWRRAISLRLIEVEETVENEPDLDQRVRMLEQVVTENPEVPEFHRLLQGAREKRDLVNGIVGRARSLEARELYGEALVQWETLQIIYPSFPRLDFEIENVRLRRELGERTARKNYWVMQINHALEEGEFEIGLQLLSSAKQEYPNDTEFSEMHTYIRQHQDLAEQAEKLIAEGRRCLEREDTAKGLEKLRRAHEIDSTGKLARPALVEGLLLAARANQGNPPQARSYLQELLSLDPGNHAAAGLLRFLDDQAEYQQVDAVLSQARQLRTSGDLNEAIKLLKQAGAEYPRNARLRQMLQEVDAGRSAQRMRDLEVVRRKRLEADGLTTVPSLNQHIASAEQIARRYEDDEDFEKESRLLRARLQTIAATSAPAASRKTPEPRKLSIGSALRKRFADVGGRTRWYALAAGAAVLIGVTVFGLARHKQEARFASPVQAESRPSVPWKIRSSPAGAHIFRDGQEIGVASPILVVAFPQTGKADLEARLDGYQSQSQVIDANAKSKVDLTFVLTPITQQLRVVGDGTLSLNGGPAETLPTGVFSGELSPGKHALHWTGRSGYDATFQVNVRDGQPATLDGPVRAARPGHALLVSVASQRARIYTTSSMPVQVDGIPSGTADGRGLELHLSNGLHTVTAGKAPRLLTGRVEGGNARLLLIATEAPARLGSLTVLTDGDGHSFKLLHGTTMVRQGVSDAGRWDLSNLPPGNYTLQSLTSSFDGVAGQPIIIKRGLTTTVTMHTKKAEPLLALRVQTLPGATISVDGKPAGITDRNGSLLVSALNAGDHHIEGRRHGKSAAMEMNLSDSHAETEAELKLDKGTGAITLHLDPADSIVSVLNATGDQMPVTGTHLELPEGRYRIQASSDGHVERTENVDLPAEHALDLDLHLVPITIGEDAPTVAGWQPALWTADSKNHSLTHHDPGIGIYSAESSEGRYVFSGSVGRGILFDKPKVEWVANYRDTNNYLLFSLDRTGLEIFTVKSGQKSLHGKRISFAPLPKYQVLFYIRPGRIITKLGNGNEWKTLDDWSDLPLDVGTGKFGFKGTVTLTSFSYLH
jgi:serine/threonine-protein kinase